MILTQAMVAYISRLVWWHCRVALLLTLVGSTSQSSSLSTSVRTKSPSVSCRYCKQQKRIISIICLRLLFQNHQHHLPATFVSESSASSACDFCFRIISIICLRLLFQNHQHHLPATFVSESSASSACDFCFRIISIICLRLLFQNHQHHLPATFVSESSASSSCDFCFRLLHWILAAAGILGSPWRDPLRLTEHQNFLVFDSSLQESPVCYSRYVLRGLSTVDLMLSNQSNHWLLFKVSEQSQTATAQLSRHPRIICTVCPLASNMNMPLRHLTEPNQVYNIMISRHTFSYRDYTTLMNDCGCHFLSSWLFFTCIATNDI